MACRSGIATTKNYGALMRDVVALRLFAILGLRCHDIMASQHYAASVPVRHKELAWKGISSVHMEEGRGLASRFSNPPVFF